MQITKPTTAEITPEVIAGWKEKHGKVTKYTTTDNKTVFFRSPTRKEVAAATTAAKDIDGVTSNEILTKAISLGGDVDILSQDKYLFGLGKHLQKVMHTVEGECEEL